MDYVLDPIKNTQDLRDFLLDCMIKLSRKEITANEARAQALLARSALDTVRLEIVSSRSGTSSYTPMIMHSKNGDDK